MERRKLLYHLGFRVWGQGGLVSGFKTGITGVAVGLLGDK